MDVPLWFMIAFLIILVGVICYAMFLDHRQYPKSIVFKRFWANPEIINNKVKLLFITHSKIPIPFLRTYSLGRYSHWAVGTIDEHDNMLNISPTGNKSIIVYLVNENKLMKLRNGNYKFKSADGWSYIINKNEIYKPKNENLKVVDVIREAYKSNNEVNYSMFKHNCHYQTLNVLNKLTNNNFKTTIDIVDLLASSVWDFFKERNYNQYD